MRAPAISAAVIAVLLAYALSFAVVNRTRALVPWITHPPWSGVADVYQPRDVQYFADQHEQTAAANIAAAAFVNQLSCRDNRHRFVYADSRFKAGRRPKLLLPLTSSREDPC